MNDKYQSGFFQLSTSNDAEQFEQGLEEAQKLLGTSGRVPRETLNSVKATFEKLRLIEPSLISGGSDSTSRLRLVEAQYHIKIKEFATAELCFNQAWKKASLPETKAEIEEMYVKLCDEILELSQSQVLNLNSLSKGICILRLIRRSSISERRSAEFEECFGEVEAYFNSQLEERGQKIKVKEHTASPVRCFRYAEFREIIARTREGIDVRGNYIKQAGKHEKSGDFISSSNSLEEHIRYMDMSPLDAGKFWLVNAQRLFVEGNDEMIAIYCDRGLAIIKDDHEIRKQLSDLKKISASKNQIGKNGYVCEPDLFIEIVENIPISNDSKATACLRRGDKYLSDVNVETDVERHIGHLISRAAALFAKGFALSEIRESLKCDLECRVQVIYQAMTRHRLYSAKETLEVIRQNISLLPDLQPVMQVSTDAIVAESTGETLHAEVLEAPRLPNETLDEQSCNADSSDSCRAPICWKHNTLFAVIHEHDEINELAVKKKKEFEERESKENEKQVHP